MTDSPTDRFSKNVTDLVTVMGEILGSAQDNAVLGSRLQLIVELVYCRIVDAYVMLLSDVLAAVFSKHPQVMKSNDQVSVEFILSHSSMEELIEAMIERKVMSLSFLGMRAVAKYFEDRLGLPLFASAEDLEIAVIAVEVRNLIVHNGGIVNRVFRDRVPSFGLPIGDRINVTRQYSIHAGFFIKSAADLAARTADKFGVR